MKQVNNPNLIVVILAAGKGLRMQSTLPKVLHPIAKQPMLGHVLKTAGALNPKKIIVVHAAKDLSHPIFDFIEDFKTHCPSGFPTIILAEQALQFGTGDAVSKAVAACDSDTNTNTQVLILYGDAPLISSSTLQRLIDTTPQNSLGLVTASVQNPTGMGRIIRNKTGEIQGIIEEKDASPAERSILEINSGLYLSPLSYLKKWLPLLTNNNQSKEYYLTDIVALAVKDGLDVISTKPDFTEEVLGVNDRLQQATSERYYQKKLAESYLKQGVWISDPNRFDLRGNLVAQKDVSIDINVILEGDIVLGDKASVGPHCVLINSKIGNNTVIGPNCVLIDVILGDNVQILANSYLEKAQVEEACVVGPFARLRPGAVLHTGAKVGNFVEVKNSEIGPYSKVNHLSYIGDTQMGAHVNIGAGVIVCNYDGHKKHHTVIEDNVLVGSDSQLIAPLKVGKGATIAAGSTVAKDVPPHQLTLTHELKQRIKENWQKPSERDELIK